MLRRTNQPSSRKALSVRVSHRFTAGSALFDEDNLVSYAGLVPVLALAEQTGLPQMIAEKVSITTPRIKSGRPTRPRSWLTRDRRDVRRRGQHRRPGRAARGWDADPVRRGVRALDAGNVVAGVQLRARPPAGVGAARAPGARCAERTELLAGIDEQAFIDIDSLLRPVYGHAKQGASYGHTKIAGKQVLRKGLSPLATTISTAQSAPVIAGMRLRAGKTGSGKGAGRMVAQAIATARAAGASGKILVRGDSAYGNRAVVRACRRADAEFSLVMTKQPGDRPRRSPPSPSTPGPRCTTPARCVIPTPGHWISDAEVAEITYTAFASTTGSDHRPAGGAPGQRRPLPRRAVPGVALSPVLHQHRPARPPQADITHRRHAIIETVFADLIDGPLAHIPSGRFGANSAWVLCAAIAHNLLRAAGILAGDAHAVARGATLRRSIDHRPRPTGPTRPHTRPAPTQPLALGAGLATAVGPHHRPQPARRCLTPTRRQPGPSTPISGKAGQTSDSGTPPTPTHMINSNQDHPRGCSADRG